ncbi:MAG TPA: hypothetical protein VNU47_01035, partial [Candidatus Paceibacterota bacterium]|nr:hypothetical protein [Candidatus Paceibacterota bacterium]
MAQEGYVPHLRSPEEELAYLRAQVEAKERELESLKQDTPREHIVHEQIRHHREKPAEQLLTPEYRLEHEEAHMISLNLDPESDD